MNVKLTVLYFVNIFVLVIGEDILVTIPNGTLRGRQEYSLRNISFYCFEQIPFAKPPVGDLRFKAPEPAEAWTGILDATSGNKICYQLQSDIDGALVETEDCLYLNVYTPQHPCTNQSLPVMVYIFGGGFYDGNGLFLHNGPHYFMENGVILVFIGYRLGPFGFLTTGDTVIPGNYGLKDQNLALKWVRDNIRYFGGDPEKVTIFGESAGAVSVFYHLMSKRSEGLFRAAIGQSGSTLCPTAYQRDYKHYAYGLATYLNPQFNTNCSSEDLLNFLKNVPASKLKEAHQSFPNTLKTSPTLHGSWFTPTVEPEHEGAFITEFMYSAIEKGRMNKVPVIIGFCSEEELWWSYQGNDAFKKTMQQFDEDPTLLVNKNMHLEDKQDKKLEAGLAIRKIYTDGLFQNNLAGSIHFLSDTVFNRAMIHHAKLQSQFSDVWFYQFSYHGRLGNNSLYVENADRVVHTEDLAYLFTTRNKSNLNDYPESDVLTSDRYRALFTNFAKTLNPTPEPSDLLQNIIWPKVRPENFQYININDSLSIERNPKGDRYTKWVEIYEQRAIKPYDTF